MKTVKNIIENPDFCSENEIPDNATRNYLVVYSDYYSAAKTISIFKSNTLDNIIDDIKAFYPLYTKYFINIYTLSYKTNKEIQVIQEMNGKYSFF